MVYDFSPSCHDRTVVSQYPPYKDLVKKVECVSCVSEDIEKCIIEFFSNNQNDVIEVSVPYKDLLKYIAEDTGNPKYICVLPNGDIRVDIYVDSINDIPKCGVEKVRGYILKGN